MRGRIEGEVGAKITGGPESFYLKSASAKLGSQPFSDGNTIEVDPTVAQTINIDWIIGNLDPGILFPQWDGRVTAYDITHNQQLDTERSDADGAEGAGSESLEVGVITTPTKIRLNIMANQDYRCAEPDVSLWKVRV